MLSRLLVNNLGLGVGWLGKIIVVLIIITIHKSQLVAILLTIRPENILAGLCDRLALINLFKPFHLRSRIFNPEFFIRRAEAATSHEKPTRGSHVAILR
jgi:hypothetical protein